MRPDFPVAILASLIFGAFMVVVFASGAGNSGKTWPGAALLSYGVAWLLVTLHRRRAVRGPSERQELDREQSPRLNSDPSQPGSRLTPAELESLRKEMAESAVEIREMLEERNSR